MDILERRAGAGVAALRKFETRVLPKLSSIKDKVQGGGQLNGREAELLCKLLERLTQEKSGMDTRPEWREFHARLVGLCHEIAVKGLENARKAAVSED